MRRIFLIILVLVGFQSLKAQEYSYHFEDEIKLIRQDVQGFIYLISNQSVCKFDGEEVHSTCLHLEKQINDAAILSEDKYFIASGNTFLVYEKQKKTLEFQLDEIITCLENFGDDIYIGTSGSGLHVYSLITKELSTIKVDGFINDILSDDNNIYFITDSDVNKINRYFEIVKTAKLPGILPKQIVGFDSGKLAVLMNDGQIVFIDSDLIINSIYNPSDFKPLEITGKNGLLFAIDKNQLKQWQLDGFKSLKNGTFNNLIQVQSQLFTTSKNTIESFNIFSKFQDIKNVFSLYPDNGAFWLGRQGKISLLQNGVIFQEFKMPSKFKMSYVSSLAKYKDKIYAGTMGMGMLVFDTNTKEFSVNFQKKEPKTNEQNIIKLQVVDDMLWVGYLNGIKVFDLTNQNLIHDFSDLMENNYLYTFHAKSPDDFYLGTSDNGLIHVQGRKPEFFFRDQSVYTIVETPKGIIFSVEDDGVYVKEDNIVSNLSDKYLLRSDDIYNISYVNGNIMFAHNQGIDILEWETNQMSYLSNESLAEPNLNANAVSGSSYLIGFENGILELQTGLLNEVHDDGLVLNPPLLFDEELINEQKKFKYNENIWSFSFESINYNAPNERYYKYRLNPLEEEWRTTTQEKVTYYNLPPGNYSFELSSGGHRNFKPAHFKTFEFDISKPFWMLSWFWGIIVIIILSSVYSIVKYREHEVLKKEQLKNAQIQYEFQRIKDQINPHFLFNSFNSLIGIVEEDPKRSVSVLEKLSDMFRTVLKYENTEIINVAEELDMAIQYFEIHKIRYQDLISLEIKDFTKKQSKFVIPMSLQLLIENAIKHNIINRHNKLEMVISEEEGYIVFTNTIKKKNKKALSLGLGLDNLIKRNELILKKRPIIEEDDMFFTVKIPYINE